jgi:hypothetical protein
LLPDRAQLAGTATAVASAVARAAVADAVAPALTDDQIDQAIDRTRWLPRYQFDEAVGRPLIVRLSGAEPVGDGADDDISAGTEERFARCALTRADLWSDDHDADPDSFQLFEHVGAGSQGERRVLAVAEGGPGRLVVAGAGDQPLGPGTPPRARLHGGGL